MRTRKTPSRELRLTLADAADRGQMFDVWLLVAALAVGGVIAYVDARPTWDDTASRPARCCSRLRR